MIAEKTKLKMINGNITNKMAFIERLKEYKNAFNETGTRCPKNKGKSKIANNNNGKPIFLRN